jgi:hypothetical protein
MKRIMGLIGFLVLASTIGFAQEAKPKAPKELKRFSEMKEIQGEVVWIKPGRAIAIVYQRDIENHTEEEILLPLDKDVELEHKKDISQISVGDTVTVQYEEITEEKEAETRQMRKAKKIIFVKPAVKKPVTTQPEEEKVLKSE